MRKAKIRFSEYPSMVKYGISFTVLAWIFFIVYTIMGTGKISILHMTIGMLVCFSIFSLKKWSRIFTSVYNFFMATMIGYEFYSAFNSGKPVFTAYFSLKVISVLLFIVAAIFLLTRSAKVFFDENGSLK